MIEFLCGIISFILGTTVTIQSAVNGRLREISQNPIFASFASFFGGFLFLFVVLLIAHACGVYSMPSLALLLQTRPWMWTAGLMGAATVIAAIVIPKQIGFASYFSMSVAGQLAGSVLADAIGFLGSEVHTPGPLRILGLLCLIVGSYLLQNRQEKA